MTATPAPVTIAAPTTTTDHDHDDHDGEGRDGQYVPTCKLAGPQEGGVVHGLRQAKDDGVHGRDPLQGVKQTAKSAKSKTGKVKLTVRSTKKLKTGQKVVVTLKSGKTTKVITAKTR